MHTKTHEVAYTWLDSPLDPILIAGGDAGLVAVRLEKSKKVRPYMADWREDAGPLKDAVTQLRAYFAKELRDFDLKLAPQGSAFQRQVWNLLQKIPYGQTTSYGVLAKQLGAPNASRAVGAANGQNPWAIVVPCHRVIGSNGTLTGYAYGLETKRALLALEGCEVVARAQGELF